MIQFQVTFQFPQSSQAPYGKSSAEMGQHQVEVANCVDTLLDALDGSRCLGKTSNKKVVFFLLIILVGPAGQPVSTKVWKWPQFKRLLDAQGLWQVIVEKTPR